MLLNGLFVTGTDTGVGKTFVTAALAADLADRGVRVAAVKPMESGCAERDGVLVAADAEIIAAAAGGWQPTDARCLYKLRAPLAPGVAARREHVKIDLDECVGFVKAVAAHADVVLVEGAGGWRVPIDDRHTIADLARRLALPVLVVGRAGLGTINHSVLTARAVTHDGCVLAAVALSVQPEDDRLAAFSNAEEISRQIRPATVTLLRDRADAEALLGRFTWNAAGR